MRTTVDLPDTLFRELKAMAAKRGTSMKIIIRAAVEEAITRQAGKKGYRVKVPLLDSKEPGTLDLTNEEIDDLLA